MRLLYVNTPVYDFLTATMIEGLNALADQGDLELVVTEQSNYARRDSVWPARRILKEADRFDAVLLGTNRDLNKTLFDAVRRTGRTVCIDGADETAYSWRPDDFLVYFKRELPIGATAPPNVLPCPLAIERRFWWEGHSPRSMFLSAAFGPRPGERAVVLNSIASMSLPNVHMGAVPGGRWIGLDGVRRGQCTLRTLLMKSSFAVGHNDRYAKVLQTSNLSLSVRGLGWDTGRFWEILGSGAVLVSRPPEIQMPAPLREGEHYLPYRSEEELRELLGRARAEPKRIESVRLAARDHVRAHHTSAARGRYVFDTIRERLAHNRS